MIRLHSGAGVIGLLSSSADSDNNFSRALRELEWDNDQPSHTCDWTVHYAYLSPPTLIILCLFKAKAHVCTLKMAEDGLGTYFASSQGMSWTV
jgi:hypothetical protein